LLFADKRSQDINDVVAQCQEWWEHNCLYLSGEARSAFLEAYLSAHDHATSFAMHQDAHLVREAWNNVRQAGEAIVRGIYLPTVGDSEGKDLTFER